MVCKSCTKIIFDFRYLIRTFHETEEYFKASLTKKEFVPKTSDVEDQQQCKNDRNQGIFHNNDGKLIAKDSYLVQISLEIFY